MVVEEQQVGPVVHRCRLVRRCDLPAQRLPLDSGMGCQDGYGRSRFLGGMHQPEHFASRQFGRDDAERRIRTIQAKRSITCVNRQVLQLYGPPFVRSCGPQGLIERSVAGQKFGAHEDFPHKGIDERGVHSVAPEVAYPCQSVARRRDASPNILPQSVPREFHGFYFFSMPASRPVEKAICRL